MIKERFLGITEYGSEHYDIICQYCSKILAEVYYAGSQYQPVIVSDCEHYRWVPIGNACYENPEISEICKGVRELLRKAVKVLQDGTTVWLLVPSYLFF